MTQVSPDAPPPSTLRGIDSSRLGLIINPIAGMGGSVGLHGTDGDAYREAARLGARPIAGKRSVRALHQLATASTDLEILTGSGTMGEKPATQVGFSPRVVLTSGDPTTARDTRKLASVLKSAGVSLILFGGGDGTARDIVSEVGSEVPVVGIPTGVKMHSAVFGHTPESAGVMATRFLESPGRVPLVPREVLDAPVGPGRVAGFSVASVPFVRDLIQPGKATVPLGDEGGIDRLCASIAAGMVAGHAYILGPGTTVARVLNHLDLEGTVVGVDVIVNRKRVLADATSRELLDLLETGLPATILLGVIGGQGSLLGRGNQQISPEVIRRVGEQNVMIIAGEGKVRGLDPPVLRVDAGIEASEPVMLGYRRVHTSPGRSIVMKVVT